MIREDSKIRQLTNREPVKEPIDKLKLQLQLAEIKRATQANKVLHPEDAALFGIMDLAINSQEKVAKKIAQLEAAKKLDEPAIEKDKKAATRYQYLNYQIWFIDEHARRSREEATRRKKHIEALNTPQKIAEEMQKCKDSIEYWFDHYAWIVDPRNLVLFAFPFVLFPFQRESLKWIDELIFVRLSDGLIDKSRDMGVTWLIICMFVYYWIFAPDGTQFHALIASYREQEVDMGGNPSTIFEKIRMQIRYLPSWMKPKGFKPKEHLTHLRCVNPENGSTIKGTTSNAETGRSGRETVIFFDEFSSVKDDISSATAASQSTNTRLFVGTPKGKLNYFAELRFNGDIPVKSFHWTKHPLKDRRWYEGQLLKMSREMAAQELNIDYDASQPGQVYESYRELYHVITKSDFMREVHGATTLDEDGKIRMRMPKEWWLGRTHDWGSSDSNGEHANLTYWVAMAKQGTRTKTHGIDIGGSVFVYRGLWAEPHSTVRMVARKVMELQQPDLEQERMSTEVMSHEALSERDTYSQEHGLHYKAWNTDMAGGIAQVRDYLEIQYKHKPHPFRLEEPNRPVLKGRPMFYIIVDDEDGEYYFDEATRTYQVRQGKNPKDALTRLRAEFPAYHFPPTEAGKAVKKQRPEKIFDDAMDCIRCIAHEFPAVAQYTIEEQVERSLPKTLQIDAAIKASPEDKARIWIARQHQLNETKIKQKLEMEAAGLNRRQRLIREAKTKANSVGRNRI